MAPHPERSLRRPEHSMRRPEHSEGAPECSSVPGSEMSHYVRHDARFRKDECFLQLIKGLTS